MTTVIRGTDNSVSAPAITGTDSDTGVYFPAANQMALATNGTQAVFIDASQNVGVGTASPTQKLDVNGTAKATTVQATTLSDGTNSTSSTNCIQGSAKAWAYFIPSTGSISRSYNISSITRNSTGNYTANFTSALPSAFYVVSGTEGSLTTSNGVRNWGIVSTGGQTATSCNFVNNNSSGIAEDMAFGGIVFHGS